MLVRAPSCVLSPYRVAAGMTAFNLTFLLAVFFFTAFISVVTGGSSLITVPVMMQLGIEPHVAVATNMLTLIFLSLGGTVAFLKGRLIRRKRLPALIGLTLSGSILGALLLLVIPAKVMPSVVAWAMIVVAVFSLANGMLEFLRSPISPFAFRGLPGMG